MSSPADSCERSAMVPFRALAVLLLALIGVDRTAVAEDVDQLLMTGACCLFQNQQCLEVAQQACNNQGGIFLGVGTSCRDGGCEIGACCINDDSYLHDPKSPTSGAPSGCLVISRAQCEALKGGLFLGEDTNCDDAPCVPVACCLPSGNCTEVLRTVCISLGGDPIAVPGGSCDGILCAVPAPTGGCCLCDGTDSYCTGLYTEDECLAFNGVYLGDGVFCKEGDDVYSFTSSPNLPIPDNDMIGISDTINVPFGFTVADIRVRLSITHTWVGDLCVTLEHDGTTITLIQRPGTDTALACHQGGPFGCPRDNYVDILLDDLGTGGSIQDQCTDDLTSPPGYTPLDPLSAFIGLQAAGPWTLHVRDRAGDITGSLISWSLELEATNAGSCGDVNPCDPPDPCALPGRPDPNDPESGDRVLRGFIVGYAVDWTGTEIRWNHLSAGATTVDYRDASAMEFPAATFPTTAAAINWII